MSRAAIAQRQCEQLALAGMTVLAVLLGPARGVCSEPAAPESAAVPSKEAGAELIVLGERGSQLYVDGRPAGALPLPQPLLLSPEEHQVSLVHESRRLQGPVRVPKGRVGELRFDYGTGALLFAVLPAVLLLPRAENASVQAPRGLSDALGLAVQREHLSLLSGPSAAATATQGCHQDAPPVLELASKTGAEYVLSVCLRPQSAGWKLTLSLWSSEVGAIAAERDAEGRGDGEQLSQPLADAFAALWSEAQSRPRGTLEVRCSVPGAAVWLDGVRAGVTPYSRATWGGRRQLEVRAPGYKIERRDVEVGDGKTQAIAVQLQPELVAAPPSERQPRPRWRMATGIATLGAATLLLGFGAAALAANGACADAPSADGAACVYLYRTGSVGAVLLGSGSALALGGTLLLALPGKRSRL